MNEYKKEVKCDYKDEHYLVRDNGAVFRLIRQGKRLRKDDDHWTFGEPNDKNYLRIGKELVHRIIATAFHGSPPTPQHVVDHKDTNRHNNRPENLRWLTKIENALNNPLTRKKIEFYCGSIEAFIKDPSILNLYVDKNPNFGWMRRVTPIEARNSYENLKELSEREASNLPSTGGGLGEWIYQGKEVYSEEKIDEIFEQVERKTGISRQELCSNKAKRGNYYEARKYAAKLLSSNLNLSNFAVGKLLGLSASTVSIYLEVASDSYSGDYAEVQERHFKRRLENNPVNFMQLNWTTKSEFPSCPGNVKRTPLPEYEAQLEINSEFYKTDYYYTTVLKSKIIDNGKSLLVMYKVNNKDNTDERWGIMKITFENEIFVHEIILNYNGTQAHYNLFDVENHFDSIVEGKDWTPKYDSRGIEFKGDYMPL